MSEWSDNIESAPRGAYVLGFVSYDEPRSLHELLYGVDQTSAAVRGYMIVGRVIFPKSKRLTRKAGTYNFKARDGRGTQYIATHWRPLPDPPRLLKE